jgi:hypothetical protein
MEKKELSMTNTQPEYRLVSRGQSLKTGEEIIELHVHVLPRGRWEKMPLEVKVIPEINWTLEEIENWIKESWSTH